MSLERGPKRQLARVATTAVASVLASDAIINAADGRYWPAIVEGAASAVLIVNDLRTGRRIRKAEAQAGQAGFMAGTPVGVEEGRIAGFLDSEMRHHPEAREEIAAEQEEHIKRFDDALKNFKAGISPSTGDISSQPTTFRDEKGQTHPIV